MFHQEASVETIKLKHFDIMRTNYNLSVMFRSFIIFKTSVSLISSSQIVNNLTNDVKNEKHVLRIIDL